MPVLEDVFEASLVDLWYDLQEQYDREMRRGSVNKGRFKSLREHATRDWLLDDMDQAMRIHQDISRTVRGVESGQRVAGQRFDDMLFVFSIAIHVLECDNDALDGAFVAGLASAFVLLPWVAIKRRAQLLQQKLRDLERELTRAKRETAEAGAQLVINTSLAVIMATTGPVGLLAGGAILVGQIVLDDQLGPSTSGAATNGSRANSTLGTLSDAVSNTKKIGATGTAVATRTGKVVPFVGFAFDVNEISVAVGNSNRISAAMAAADAALKALQKEIQLNQAKIDRFFAGMRKWQRQLAAINESAASARADLGRAMEKTGYSI